ncbi:MAG: chromate transporter, partial [Pseudomonadota bacterium]
QMMDGLGLAETTPGPLILVLQFVGMLAGAGESGIGLALAAGVVTLWVTFVPCFLWIFVGATYVDWIASRPKLAGALQAITAAVVGVILNLSVWFAVHVFFDSVTSKAVGPLQLLTPDLSSLRLMVCALAALAGVLLLWKKLPLWQVLGVCAALSASLTIWS